MARIQDGRVRRLAALEKRLLALRAQAGKLKRQETAAWREIQSLLGRQQGKLTVMADKRRGGRGSGGAQPTSGSLTAVARMAGSSGLFCGCAPVRIIPQPNGDVDVCVLVECSNDPATSGFRCSYWCGTLEAEPIVAIARRKRRARRRR